MIRQFDNGFRIQNDKMQKMSEGTALDLNELARN